MTDEIRQQAQALVQARHLTQEQLAEAAGVKQATVSRFLNGRRNRADDGAIAILGALGLELTVRPKQKD